ncbi:MAG: hypothetical protein P1U88_04705 [Thalassobaculaceae bacterium]|nr:hypothetical protein [Thalassobaculaceae bacterium]
MKVAVVTPYRDEPEAWVQAMIASVAAQSHRVTHVLVGDGLYNPAYDGDGRINLSLSDAANDSGGTPRAAGGAWAVQNGYEIVVYVDADDRVDPGFAAALVRTHQAVGAEVISVPHAYYDRNMRPARNLTWQHIGVWAHGSARQIGGTFYNFMPASGLALAGRGLDHVGDWTRVPKALSRVHDVFFSQALISRPYVLAWLGQALYHYRLTHAHQYERFNLAVPYDLESDAKVEGNETAIAFLSKLDDAGRRALEAKFGIRIELVPEQGKVRQAVATAHNKRGALVRGKDGQYGIFVPT